MSTAYNNQPAVPKWIWALLGAAVLMLISATIMVARVDEGNLTKTDVAQADVPGPPESAPPQEPQGMAVTPAVPQVPADNPGTARVTVTPAGSAKAKPAKPEVSGQKPQESVKDMFPVGHMSDSTPAKPESEAAVDESFPDLTYQGRTWKYTGKTVPDEALEVQPLSDTPEGRVVYGLDSDGSDHQVLFVRSQQDPGRMAVYRAPTA